MRDYRDFLARKRRQFGSHFVEAGLDERFVAYYESGQRIRVLCADGRERTGRVGVTNTRLPSFLLLRRSLTRDPSWVLGPDDRVMAVQVTGRWQAVSG